MALRSAEPAPTLQSASPPRWRLWLTALVVVLALGLGCCYCSMGPSDDPFGKPGDHYASSDDALLPEDGQPRKTGKSFLGASRETVDQVRTRTLCVLFLCLQYSLYAILRRYSTGILKEVWSSSSVLGMGEAIKFGISLAVIAADDKNSDAPPAPIHLRLRWLLANSIKMAVPAVVYLTMNMLGFTALHRIDAGTFAVIQQSKIFFTALFLRLFLSRSLSTAKWCALCALVLGVLLISLESHPRDASCAPDATAAASASPFATAAMVSYSVGVVAVTLDSMLSGFATVYFEMVLKSTTLTVWDRNLQLAVYSMAIYLPWAVYENPTNPFKGWSLITLFVSLLGALGGILVAMVIKYADGLAKNLSTASSIVLTTAASHILFSGEMNTSIIIGSLVVVVSGYNYQNVQ